MENAISNNTQRNVARSLRAHTAQILNLVWLSVLSASKSLKMDLIEGRVRYRKGKKVSCKSWIMLGAFQYSFIFCLLQWKIRWAVLRRVNPATGKLCTFLTQIIYTMIFVANTNFNNWVL